MLCSLFILILGLIIVAQNRDVLKGWVNWVAAFVKKPPAPKPPVPPVAPPAPPAAPPPAPPAA